MSERFSPTATAVWPVRNSFVDYVRAANGEVSPLAPWSLSSDGFRFPLRRLDGAKTETLEADGGACFTAHAGRLAVELRQLRLAFANGGFEASVRDLDVPETWMTIARGDVEALTPDRLMLRPRLTFFGSRLFGDVYQVGEPLDDMILETQPS